MLMPIVSMNKMSMNESVAASCCWRYVLGVHEQYPEILHGGKIGTTYEVKLQLKGDYVANGVASGWLSQGYDVAPVLAWQRHFLQSRYEAVVSSQRHLDRQCDQCCSLCCQVFLPPQ